MTNPRPPLRPGISGSLALPWQHPTRELASSSSSESSKEQPVLA